METSLHRQLKQFYAGELAQTEVRLGRYRIDAVVDNELIEIQHGSLSAIGAKILQLLKKHRVKVVKPIVVEKHLLKCAKRGGEPIERRRSPKRGRVLDVFDELIFFTRVFPHRRLTIELVLVDVEELRYPGHGRRRRWRRNDFVVEDQRLVQVHETVRLATLKDLRRLCHAPLPSPFETRDLATHLELPRVRAQRVAYCLRQMGATIEVGKRGNARLYRWSVRRAA